MSKALDDFEFTPSLFDPNEASAPSPASSPSPQPASSESEPEPERKSIEEQRELQRLISMRDCQRRLRSRRRTKRCADNDADFAEGERRLLHEFGADREFDPETGLPVAGIPVSSQPPPTKKKKTGGSKCRKRRTNKQRSKRRKSAGSRRRRGGSRRRRGGSRRTRQRKYSR